MKLSIIMPCYNVANVVSRAMFSLMNQKLTDIEVICIEDKSIDNTRDMLKRLAKADLRIKILENEETMGQEWCKNQGIDKASGDFVAFMDPEDWVESDFYQNLVSYAEQKNVDVVCGEITKHEINGEKSWPRKQMKKNWCFFHCPYGAIYSKHFLDSKGIGFSQLLVGADVLFEAMVKVYVSGKIHFVHNSVYHRCKIFDSMEIRSWTQKHVDDFVVAISRTLDLFKCCSWITYENYKINVRYCLDLIVDRFRKSPETFAEFLCKLVGFVSVDDEWVKQNYRLFRAMLSGCVGDVVDVLYKQQVHTKEYRLLKGFCIATLRYSKYQSELRILGIPVFVVKK